MSRNVTAVVPPTSLAQLTGMYRIDIGARVVKGYRYDGSVSHRSTLKALPAGFVSMGYAAMADALRKAERCNV